MLRITCIRIFNCVLLGGVSHKYFQTLGEFEDYSQITNRHMCSFCSPLGLGLVSVYADAVIDTPRSMRIIDANILNVCVVCP